MADNVTLPGTGEVVATDEVDGAQVQLVKPAFGTDGVSTLGTPTNPSTGVYTIAYTPATEGEYVWWATGTGSDAKSAKGKFLVSDSVP